MRAALNDEYQDGTSMGSLVSARECWLDLQAARELIRPQRFFFAFDCPSRLMALGLVGFLRYAPYAGLVDARDGTGARVPGAWQVAGSTRPQVRSLSCLEHLFMGLRQAAARYDSDLVTLDILPVWGACVTGD
jgi:hypothetical protein